MMKIQIDVIRVLPNNAERALRNVSGVYNIWYSNPNRLDAEFGPPNFVA